MSRTNGSSRRTTHRGHDERFHGSDASIEKLVDASRSNAARILDRTQSVDGIIMGGGLEEMLKGFNEVSGADYPRFNCFVSFAGSSDEIENIAITWKCLSMKVSYYLRMRTPSQILIGYYATSFEDAVIEVSKYSKYVSSCYDGMAYPYVRNEADPTDNDLVQTLFDKQLFYEKGEDYVFLSHEEEFLGGNVLGHISLATLMGKNSLL